jgi:hypothetical protein
MRTSTTSSPMWTKSLPDRLHDASESLKNTQPTSSGVRLRIFAGAIRMPLAVSQIPSDARRKS